MAKRETFPCTGNDNYGRPKSDYLKKIENRSDAALLEEVELKVWLSAFAINNPGSDYHWQTDALYDECQRRKKPEIYVNGWEKARASCG